MRYRELCIDAQNPSRVELTENNFRRWRVRYDRCQRRVADEACRFLILLTQITVTFAPHRELVPTQFVKDIGETRPPLHIDMSVFVIYILSEVVLK
jgi:hypothetical protein